jgi:nucleoside-diphosphate-sugar epimerase
MPRALVLGGTGMIGSATARRLLAAGWDVDLAGRDSSRLPADVAAAGGRFVAAERGDSPQLRAALGDGADLLVDCLCYTAADATRLLPLAHHAGSTVMISSKAVYVDAEGNHSNSETAPRFDRPIRETQPTMIPGDGDYTTREGYGANKVAAEQVLLESGLPVTVLRPSKIHGRGAARPREWSSSSACSIGVPPSSSRSEAPAPTTRPLLPTSPRSSRWSPRSRDGAS